ncbi:MAG: hypothetical protein FWD61_15280 [Phycisphaerales bacterium]|nr:hypothetical protein [Phycisphaerales bacterium]
MTSSLLRLAIFNPILLRVVMAGGRRLRHAFVRWGYLGLLIMVLLVVQLSSAAGERALSDLAKAASQVFSAISYVQLAMICLLAPVFCAAAITQERDSQTYNILLATPLTNLQIVLGSLFSRLYYVVALLLSGLPVFAITLLYGGVTGQSIMLSFAIAMSTALFTGSLAIAIAVFRLGSGKTVFWFYVFNAIYLVAVYLADQFWLSGVKGGGGTTVLTGIHPFLALKSVVSATAYPTPEPGAVADHMLLAKWYLLYPARMYVAITTVASLAMVVPSAIVLRRIAQVSDAGLWAFLWTVLRRGKEGRTRRARSVWQNPVAWREAATRAGFSGRGLMRWLTILVGLAAALAVMYMYHTKKLDLHWARMILMGLVIVEFSVSLLVATNTSASAVTKERESQTLDLLLVTPITSRYYIWGKLRGLVSFMLPFAAVPTITMLIVVVYDAVRTMMGGSGCGGEWVVWPETVLTMPLYLTAIMAWACMLGLQLSLKWSRTIVAVMASVGALAGICAVLGVCGFAAAGSFGPVGPVVGAISPFTTICMLIYPGEFMQTAFGSGKVFEIGTSAELGGHVTVAVSILVASTVYCLAIWGMYRSMVKNFDMIIRKQHQ